MAVEMTSRYSADLHSVLCNGSPGTSIHTCAPVLQPEAERDVRCIDLVGEQDPHVG